MNKYKLVSKLCRLCEMQKQPVVLPKKLVLGDNTSKQKQIEIPLGHPWVGF